MRVLVKTDNVEVKQRIIKFLNMIEVTDYSFISQKITGDVLNTIKPDILLYEVNIHENIESNRFLFKNKINLTVLRISIQKKSTMSINLLS